jgi:hypothetical protein
MAASTTKTAATTSRMAKRLPRRADVEELFTILTLLFGF